MIRRLHRLFDHPVVFDAYQKIVDGGKARQIRRFLADVEYRDVLDVGCGTGNWSRTARGRYLGVDVSEGFVDAARRRHAGKPQTRYLVLDPTKEDVPGRFDLVQMISVLHHLSDDAVARLLPRVMAHARYLFVLDLYPMPRHPVARLLYAADRGDFIRAPDEQERLIRSAADLRLVKRGSYVAPSGLYRHTLFLFERS